MASWWDRLQAAVTDKVNTNWQQPVRQPVGEPEHPAAWLAAQPDSMVALYDQRIFPGHFARLHVGFTSDGWVTTPQRTHLLVLGPPQGGPGKSSGVLAPNVIAAPGPVVVVSTKLDLMMATAVARRRTGELCYWDPQGGRLPDGFHEIRYSPMSGCESWETAVAVADAWFQASNTAGTYAGGTVGDNTFHFQARAADLFAVLLHYGAVSKKDMRWLIGVVAAADPAELETVREKLAATADSELPTRVLSGILDTPPRERGSFYSSLAVGLRVFQSPAVLASTDNPNWQPRWLVGGRPGRNVGMVPVRSSGLDARIDHIYRALDKPVPDVPPWVMERLPQMAYDTLYVAIPAERQRTLAPLLVSLLTAIRHQRYELTRRNAESGIPETYIQPTTFVLDELYGLADPTLPGALADGGSQHVLYVLAAQDLSQIKQKWGAETGEGFLTLCNVLALPGIRDRYTLELLSLLSGEFDRPHWQAGEQMSYTTTRTPRLSPADVYAGHPQNPDLSLYFTTQVWDWVYVTPYFRAKPWPDVLLDSMEFVAQLGVPLPVPELDREGDGRYLGPGSQLYHQLRQHQRQLAS